MLRYIIDGYNLIKSEHSRILGGSLESQRNELISLININKPQGSEKNSVTVVFDGRAESPFSGEGYSRQNALGIEILYSENTNADRIIERLVEENENPANIVIVTDDRGIRRMTAGRGVKFIGTAEFWKKLAIKAGTKGTEQRDTGVSSDNLNKELKEKWLGEK